MTTKNKNQISLSTSLRDDGNKERKTLRKIIKGPSHARETITKLCFRAPTIASSFASKDIIGRAKLGRADSIWKKEGETNHYK